MDGVRAAIAGVMLVAGLGACDQRQDYPERAFDEGQERQLRFGNGSEPKTLDPNLSTLVPDGRVIAALFQGLVDMDPAGNFIPGQAESWTISDDGLIYTFTIRQGLQWSDGTPITAHDFVYALRRVTDPTLAAEFASFYYPILNAAAVNRGELPAEALGVEALGDHLLQVTLEQPKPSLIELFSHISSFPVPRHVIERVGQREWLKPEHIVSNGAYVLKSWVVGDRIEVEKNPLFHEAETVEIDRVFYYPTENTEAAFNRFRAGGLDVDSNFPLSRVDWLRQNMPQAMRVEPQWGVYFYSINITRPPFDDVRVRRALAMAIDRELITRTILRDIGFLPAYSFVPPLLPSYQAPEAQPWQSISHQGRVELARSLLAELGYGPDNPLTFDLSYNTSDEHRQIAVAVAKMWEAIGVKATLSNTEFSVHDENMKTGLYDVARRGWVSTFDSPEYFLNILHTNAIPLNAARYSSPQFDRLLDDALRLPRVADRVALMRQAEKLMLADMPIIPIYFYVDRHLVAPYVTGWVDNPTGRHRVRFLGFSSS